MNPIKMLEKLYSDMFSHMYDSETDMNRVFTDLHEWHNRALPESESPIVSTYAKVCKSSWFALAGPFLYMYLKYLIAKFCNDEYIRRLVEREVDEM